MSEEIKLEKEVRKEMDVLESFCNEINENADFLYAEVFPSDTNKDVGTVLISEDDEGPIFICSYDNQHNTIDIYIRADLPPDEAIDLYKEVDGSTKEHIFMMGSIYSDPKTEELFFDEDAEDAYQSHLEDTIIKRVAARAATSLLKTKVEL